MRSDDAAFKKALIERALGAEMSQHLGLSERRQQARSEQRQPAQWPSAPRPCWPAMGRCASRCLATARAVLRAGAHPQARAPLHRVRRQDRGHVRARHDDARDPGASCSKSYAVSRSRPSSSARLPTPCMAEVTAWQARPLEPMYPVVFFDALRVKIKRGRSGAKQGHLPGAGRAARRHTRHPGPVDREALKGAKFFDEGVQRPEDPRCWPTS